MKNVTLKFTVLAVLLIFFNACKKDNVKHTEDNENYSSYRLDAQTIIHRFVIDGNAIYINEVNGTYFFAEDIILSGEQFNMLKQLSDNGGTSERSTIAQKFIQTWPNSTVYYQLPDSSNGALTASQYNNFVNTINAAFDSIETHTPVRFVLRTTQPEYIKFVKSTGNNSPLGWSKNRVNTINLYNYTHIFITAHEIMHSLGIMHEQCRPDRNQFVIVDTSKVQDGREHNYNIYFDYAGFGPFDFESVMLYSSTSFAKNSSDPPMTRLDGSTFTGQRSKISDGDYAGISHLYAPFNAVTVDGGIYRIGTPLITTRSFDIEGGGSAEGTATILYSNHTGNNQKFLFRKADHGYFIIKSMVDTSKVLTVRGSGTTNGTVVELRSYAGTDAQKWYLYNLGNSGFSFHPKNASSLRLEVKDGLTANLTPIVVGTAASNAARQQFLLTRLN